MQVRPQVLDRTAKTLDAPTHLGADHAESRPKGEQKAAVTSTASRVFHSVVIYKLQDEG